MDTDSQSQSTKSGVYPLDRCKILHLVRHGQGIHNLEEVKHLKQSPQLFDAQLSPYGWEQVDNLRTSVRQSGLFNRIKLVVVSPLLRTLQTAAGVFGGGEVDAKDEIQPVLMLADSETKREAISSMNCPSFLAVELCRERLGRNTCDKRRTVREYKNLFPAVDFSLIETDEDTWWTPDDRESYDHVAARGLKFVSWLWTREEEEIAVVTHSDFLFFMLGQFGSDCSDNVKQEMQKFFSNCELRSIVLVDQGGKVVK